MNAKRLFIQIANQDPKSMSETETNYTKNGTEYSLGENNAETYLDSLNIDIKLEEVERNFYKKRAKYSNKIQSIVLAVVYGILVINAIVFLFFANVEENQKCDLSNKPVIGFFTTCGLSLTLILTIKCIQIRKVNDVFKMRNEIYQFLVVEIIFHLAAMIIYNNDSITFDYNIFLFIWVTVLFSISFGYPLYLSYQKKYSIGDIEKKNTNKEKNSYHKFIDIIKNPEKVKFFIEFSKVDFSVENIIFYRSVKAYQSLRIRHDRRRLYKKIIDNFLKSDSKLEINISSRVRTNILETTNMNTKNPQRDCFDEALEEIIQLMYINSYPSFLQHNLYSEMIINTETLDKNYFLKAQSSEDTQDLDQQKDIKLKTVKHCANEMVSQNWIVDDIVTEIGNEIDSKTDHDFKTKNESSISDDDPENANKSDQDGEESNNN
ncbi:double hit isoform b [Anaeramoeba flamelloides]|uniref:Double hit isoform b n=1 Tax=Anaeramoeba flamelloides TaxID=1746091 RepID=A0AAV7Z7E0_9EUKA|nr:double hit isoform b [Anaeramoeba flamelloides]